MKHIFKVLPFIFKYYVGHICFVQRATVILPFHLFILWQCTLITFL